MKEKWIVDDAGTLINISTRNHYDYMEEVVDVLNKLSEENDLLKMENYGLQDGLDFYKEENEQLKKEKEFWKGDSCQCSNYLSILSMDCQIVQEVIWDLKKVIDVDTEASKLLDELDDKFDKLNQHRIRMYSR